MAPPHKQIEEALIQSTCRVFLASPETTTVNKVRRFVEDAYHLDDGFLSAGDWKQTSKALILDCVVCACRLACPRTPAPRRTGFG